MKLLKKIFGTKTRPTIKTITCGERDKFGFCDTYVNGEKTNVRMLIFTEDEIKRLHDIKK